MSDKIKYSEIFHSIQGEGQLTGTPSVFFRTSFCNLRCSWCDTWYTSHEPENKDITIISAYNEIMKYNCKHIVITGGEPFIQPGPLSLLCEKLHAAHRHITIETNGTTFKQTSADLISCSPKLKNSNPGELVSVGLQRIHNLLRINSLVLQEFQKHYNTQFKFVVSVPEDLIEIESIVKQIVIDPNNVFLMPEGRTKVEIEQKEYWLVKKCMDNGYRYSDRLHVRLWNDRRGV